MVRDYEIANLFRFYKNCAVTLPNYNKLSDLELANGYLQAKKENNEYLRNKYISVLMVRFWYKIDMFVTTTDFILIKDRTEAVNWLYESLELMFEYPAWIDENNKLYNNPNVIEICVNKCCSTMRLRKIKYYTQDKRVTHIHTTEVERCDRLIDDMSDVFEDEATNLIESRSCASSVVKSQLKRNLLLDALVVDSLCFKYDEINKLDARKSKINVHKRKFNVSTDVVSIPKLELYLKMMSDKDFNRFGKMYNISKSCINTLKGIVNRKTLSVEIEDVFTRLRKNDEVLKLLCY